MLAVRTIFYQLLKWPVRLFIRCKVVCDNLVDTLSPNPKQPILYVVRHQSASDLLALQKACEQQNLPDPLSDVVINGKHYKRTWCIDKPTPLLFKHSERTTDAVEQGLQMLKAHQADPELDAQLIPANIIWGRQPSKERNNANVGTLLADQESPNWLRKLFIVIFLGRHTLVRLSNPMSFRYMSDNHGTTEKSAQKLVRIARFHFYRQTIAATGPRLMHRQQMFTALFANPAVKRVIKDEMASKKLSEAQVKKQALAIMDEIAGDYRDSTIRFGERILTWLFNRLYKKIAVQNADNLRNIAQRGDEIVYVPCHRSHMDYLLLTYVIYHQGLVTPRIAAGINLNFWPAGPIFRKAGAFFIRRSFRGNRLYSTIFREYLALLFERGYAVKYYTEGGRSRTGKLLQPKTGMLAMTIQSMLRGIDRPITLIPVYLGYEHVMEVATYHKELSGVKKQNESIMGVIKAIRNLRNYGMGYVNFGPEINLNQFLCEQAPDWKASIDPVDPQKPQWLTPTVNLLADKVMTSINQCVAFNGVALISMILLASEHHAMTKNELIAQLDFILMILKSAPYSEWQTLPEENGQALVEHVIGLNKVTVTPDALGEIVSLTEAQQLDLSYYRNNILHGVLLPAFVCRLLDKHNKVSHASLIRASQCLMTLFKHDFFLWQNAETIAQQVEQLLTTLADNQFVTISHEGDNAYYALVDEPETIGKVSLLANCADQSLQRVAILLSVLKQSSCVSKTELEEKATALAKRLSMINDSNSPEFTDKKAQANIVNAFYQQQLIDKTTDGKWFATDNMAEFERAFLPLLEFDVLQSLKL